MHQCSTVLSNVNLNRFVVHICDAYLGLVHKQHEEERESAPTVDVRMRERAELCVYSASKQKGTITLLQLHPVSWHNAIKAADCVLIALGSGSGHGCQSGTSNAGSSSWALFSSSRVDITSRRRIKPRWR